MPGILHRSQCIPSYLHHNPIHGSEKCKCTLGTLDNSSTSGNGTFITIQSWKWDSYTINLLRACSWEKAVKEVRIQDMAGGSQAKIRVLLTLFPPGALVLNDNTELLHLRQRVQTFHLLVFLNNSVIGPWPLPGRGFVTSGTSTGERVLVSWGQFSREWCIYVPMEVDTHKI